MNHAISHWVRHHAGVTPGRLAIKAPDRTLTYADLQHGANRAAATLAQLGLVKGDRLAVYMANCPEWFEILVGAARLGLIVVPLNIRLTVAELQYQLQDAGCKALIASPEFGATVPELIAGSPVQHTRLTTDPYATADGDPGDAAGDDDPLLIVYTSGTTGKPKGAVLSHANLLYNALNNSVGLGLTAEDITLTVLPLFHVGGIGLFATPALYTGATVILPRRFDPAEALRLIEQERVTVTMTVPTIMQAYLLAYDRMEPKPDLSSCRGFISGGAPCPQELIDMARDRGFPYGQGFGMTETGPTVFLQPEMMQMRNLPPGAHIGKPGTIGTAVLFTEVKLVDDAGQEVPQGEVGEVCMRGGNVFTGYWNLPEATAKSFTADGFFRSGDLARADQEGYITIMGRKKEMLISGGENIYPLEVEQVLADHPAVAEVAVVGVPDPKWGEIPAAAVVWKAGRQATAEELTAWCRTRLAGYKTPKRWLFLDALPRTAIGKVIKPQIVNLLQKES